MVVPQLIGHAVHIMWTSQYFSLGILPDQLRWCGDATVWTPNDAWYRSYCFIPRAVKCPRYWKRQSWVLGESIFFSAIYATMYAREYITPLKWKQWVNHSHLWRTCFWHVWNIFSHQNALAYFWFADFLLVATHFGGRNNCLGWGTHAQHGCHLHTHWLGQSREFRSAYRHDKNCISNYNNTLLQSCIFVLRNSLGFTPVRASSKSTSAIF